MKRQRLRQLGYGVGKYQTGQKNAIVDIAGVKVGHVTIEEDISKEIAVRTGVTAILPHGDNLFQEKVLGAAHVINGFGKSVGLVQLEELGLIESPIMLTNTLSVPAVQHGTIQYMLAQNPEIGVTTGTVNTIVGECNDSFLNDIRGLHVIAQHAQLAIEQASTDNVEEGAIGAGTGMSCLGFKGGIGTSSRVTEYDGNRYSVGALVLSNFGKSEELEQAILGWGKTVQTANGQTGDDSEEQLPDGSILLILATDAPLNERQLKRLAKRATFGLARTGSYAAHGSGDIAIAFSTAQRIPHNCSESVITTQRINESGELINQLFEMAAEAIHESILNSLCKAEHTIGRNGNSREAFPYDLLGAWKN